MEENQGEEIRNRISSENEVRISELQGMLKAKEEKICVDERYLEKLHEEIDYERDETKSRFQDLYKEKDLLQKKDIQLNLNLEAKDKKINETQKLCQGIEAQMRENILKLQEAEETKGHLKEMLAQLRAKLKSRDQEIEVIQKLRQELEKEMNESRLKLQESEKEKYLMKETITQMRLELDIKSQKLNERVVVEEEKLNELKAEKDRMKNVLEIKIKREKDFEEEITSLKSEFEIRDKKIELDAKYYKELILKVEDIKRKTRADLEEAMKGTGPALKKELDREREDKQALEQKIGEFETMLEEREGLKSTEREKDEKITRLEEDIRMKDEERALLEEEMKKNVEENEQNTKEYESILARLENLFGENEKKREHIQAQLETEQKLKAELEEKITQLKQDKESPVKDEGPSREQITLEAMVEERDKTIRQMENEKAEILAKFEIARNRNIDGQNE